jgi:hypothetical protein
MLYRLGKKAARPDAVKLKLSAVLKADKLPTPPTSFGHESNGADWGMLGNDTVGDCVFAGSAHETMLWATEGRLNPVPFTTANVLSDYSAVTGYNPNDPNSDQGSDVQQVAAYRKNTGIIDATGVRHKIDAYAAVEGLSQLDLAVWLFGAVGVGVNLPSSAEDQFTNGQVWDVVPNDTIQGGHYIPAVGKNSAGNYVFITWGKLQAATPQWVSTYMDEAVAYLSLDILNASSKMSPEGFDLSALTQYLGEV